MGKKKLLRKCELKGLPTMIQVAPPPHTSRHATPRHAAPRRASPSPLPQPTPSRLSPPWPVTPVTPVNTRYTPLAALAAPVN